MQINLLSFVVYGVAVDLAARPVLTAVLIAESLCE
jgi:hypothetical protein